MTVRAFQTDGASTAQVRKRAAPSVGALDMPAARIVHAAVAGRVRLSVPGLKRQPDRASPLEALALSWFGVAGASASAHTGNLLLEFDPAATTADVLARRVQTEADRWTTPATDRRGAPSQPHFPLPPPPRPRTRAMEAALGSAALVGAGVLLLAVRAHGHNLVFDQAPLALAEEIHNPPLTALMRGASRLVEPSIIWPLTVAATLMGVGRRTPGDVPWLAPTAVLGGGAVITVLKAVLRRGRPTAFEHLVPTRGYSLPSGHAFLAVCLYGLLAHHALRWLRARRPEDRRAAAILLAGSATVVILVGVSRVYLGVHYPTDVVAGYALALLWLFFLAAINDRPRPVPAA